MTALTIVKYKPGQCVKLARGGIGLVVDVIDQPPHVEEARYIVGFRDGQQFEYTESELLPCGKRDMNGHNKEKP